MRYYVAVFAADDEVEDIDGWVFDKLDDDNVGRVSGSEMFLHHEDARIGGIVRACTNALRSFENKEAS